VLITICQLFHEKFKGTSSKKAKENEEEDDITMQNSDEEENEVSQEIPLVEVLKENMAKIAEMIKITKPDYKVEGSYDRN